MPARPNESLKGRAAEASEAVEKIIDWIRHECGLRVVHQSHGDMTVLINWKDGRLNYATVGGQNVIKPGKTGNLPGSGVDPT
jgi:hypothetical protein